MRKSSVRSFRTVISLALVFALLVPGLSVYAAEPAVPDANMVFTDIYPKNWAYDYIFRMFALGVMNGVSEFEFGPKLNMTRAMFVTSLMKLDGEDKTGYSTDEFDDVAEDAYYNAAVAWAKDKGVASGTAERTFSPDKEISREEIVFMLFNYCKSKEIDVSGTDETLLLLFYDEFRVEKYAREAFAWAVNHGLITGVSKACASPKTSATREQIACILWKLLCYDPAEALPIPEKVHLVRFLNYDGTLIFAMRVADGDSAVYPFPTPQKPMDHDFRYNFTGWSEPYDNITGDTDIEAVYESVRRIYCTVTFQNYDGGLLQRLTVELGGSVTYSGPTPVRPTDAYCSYTFTGWDGSSENVTDNVVLTAKFASKTLTGGKVDNRYDTFTYGMINVNNSEFRLSKSLYDRLLETSVYAGGRKIGFYLLDLATGMSVGYNSADSFPTASTVKLGLALYAYKQIAAGNASLSTRITYRPWHYCEGSGVLINSASYGQSFTLKYLLHVMIYESDNIAYYMVHDYFGTAGYNNMIKSLGGFNTHASTTTWGYLSPWELGLIWQEIYRFRDTCWEGEYFFDELLNAKFNFIKRALGSKYKKVAHKSGFNPKGYHDSAIIFGDRPFVMVIMMSPAAGDNQGYLTKMAKLLDEVENEYINWLIANPR